MLFKNRSNIVIGFLLAFLTSGQVRAAPLDSTGTEFIVLHNNDMHARFEQTGVHSERCSPTDAASNKCYGGFARTAHEIRKFREAAKQPGGMPVLYLNAGDTYSGTPWFYVYKDNITSAFMNALQPDAISLGNHEFDEGIKGLIPFLNHANFPVLAANLDLTKIPELAATKSLKRSTIIEVNGTKVGIIGYLTPETGKLALTDGLQFVSEIEGINKEADVLRQQGVTIFIALGHSGFQMDQAIAMNCPLVDVVIGGHTNTFLYTGKEPDMEKSQGPYPKVVRQSSGKEVPVVQAYAYTKYLGYLKLKFDTKGNLKVWNGEPILLNATIPEDSDVLRLLAAYRPGIEAQEQNIVGYTKVLLDGQDTHCREIECNFGNLVTDTMVHARALEYDLDDFWSDTSIAFLQGGGIRASIPMKDDGSISRSDLIQALPYDNELVVIEVTGKTIRNMLELSASKLGYGFGGFLQMSGVHVAYDASSPVGSRVKSVRVLCAKCNIPRYFDLDEERSYKAVITSFLLNGGDGYSIPTLSEPHKLKVNDIEAMEQYIQARSPIYPGVEWRITVEGDVPETTTPSITTTTEGSGTNVVASGFLVLVCLLLNHLR